MATPGVEIEIRVKIGEECREHLPSRLLAGLGPFTTGGEEGMAQTLTLVNSVAPHVTSFKLGPFEKIKPDGTDDGPDTLAVVCTSGNTSLATVAADPDGTSTVSLVPGTAGAVTIEFDDHGAGGTASGSLDLTITAPPDTLTATIGTPSVS